MSKSEFVMCPNHCSKVHSKGESFGSTSSACGTPTDATESASALLRRDKTVALP